MLNLCIEVEIMHSCLENNNGVNSCYKSHINEKMEESPGEEFAIDNLFIDDNEVGFLVSDAIESPNDTYYECVSPSPFMHSPYIKLEFTINCGSKYLS